MTGRLVSVTDEFSRSRYRDGGTGLRMVVAVESGEVVVDGIREHVIAGVTRWASNHPDLQRPEVARLFGRASRSRGGVRSGDRSTSPPHVEKTAPSEQGERPSWYLGPREPRRRSDEELQRTARHEAAHAAAAYLLDWEVNAAGLSRVDGSGVEFEVGHVDVLSPRDLDPTLRARQWATITLAAKEHVGWTYDDAGGRATSYRSDRREAWQALARVGTDPRHTGRLYEAARADAKRLAEDSTFRCIASAVERELLEQGELVQPELSRLLRRAKADAWNPRGRA